NHERRFYPRWQSGSSTTTGPTPYYREDWGNNYVEQVKMTATPHLTGSGPDRTEAGSGLQTLTPPHRNSRGQGVRDDGYFNLAGVTYSTSQYLGTQKTNYYTTLKDYDVRGRPSRMQHPTSTIERTVYDSLDRPISSWVGTNDSPSNGQPWSP